RGRLAAGRPGRRRGRPRPARLVAAHRPPAPIRTPAAPRLPAVKSPALGPGPGHDGVGGGERRADRDGAEVALLHRGGEEKPHRRSPSLPGTGGIGPPVPGWAGGTTPPPGTTAGGPGRYGRPGGEAPSPPGSGGGRWPDGPPSTRTADASTSTTPPAKPRDRRYRRRSAPVTCTRSPIRHPRVASWMSARKLTQVIESAWRPASRSPPGPATVHRQVTSRSQLGISRTEHTAVTRPSRTTSLRWPGRSAIPAAAVDVCMRNLPARRPRARAALTDQHRHRARPAPARFRTLWTERPGPVG